jgi:hypothetical protein
MTDAIDTTRSVSEHTRTIHDAVTKLSSGRFMTVTFRKLNGEERRINGRIGVRYQGKGAAHRKDTRDRQYLLLWSIRDRGYRRILMDTITRIAAEGSVIYSRSV